MWELDYKGSLALKNWCFWAAVLEKTLESHLDCKEIQPVHPKGNQSWIFIGRTDVEAETPILWPADAKSWLIWRDLLMGKIEGRRRRGQKRTRWLNGISDLMDMTLPKLWDLVEDREAWRAASMGLQRVGQDLATELTDWQYFKDTNRLKLMTGEMMQKNAPIKRKPGWICYYHEMWVLE